MSSTTKKILKKYIVWKGRIPGVYDTWQECERQVKGVSAVYKSYSGISLEEARRIYNAGPKSDLADYGRKDPDTHRKAHSDSKPQKAAPPPSSWAVDAATSHNPGPMEYRGVDIDTGQVLFASKVYPLGTNNIGEFLAIVHAIALMCRTGERHVIFSDSRNALSWVRKGVCKTQLPHNAETNELFDVIDRAVAFLKKVNLLEFDLRKWPTDTWGEIPADYGRK